MDSQGLTSSDLQVLEDFLSDRQQSIVQSAADAAADAVLEDVRNAAKDNAAVVSDAAALVASSASASDTSSVQVGTVDQPAYVTLSDEQWGLVYGSMRFQNTVQVFGLLLLGVLVGAVLWGQLAANLRR